MIYSHQIWNLTEVTPVYKKKSKNSKDNYRPVNIFIIQYLRNLRKMYLWSNSALLPFFIVQISIRISLRLQRTTLLDNSNWEMEEKCWQWRCTCVTFWSMEIYGKLVTKLDEYGFDKSSLKLIHSYLSNRKQRVKINDRYSSWIYTDTDI